MKALFLSLGNEEKMIIFFSYTKRKRDEKAVGFVVFAG